MGIIKPTLTLTASSSAATTNPGPMSVALSVSATDSLYVKEVASIIVDITSTHVEIWDASDYFTTNANMFIDGGFMYFKNLLVQNPSDATDVNHAINIGDARGGATNLDGVDEGNATCGTVTNDTSEPFSIGADNINGSIASEMVGDIASVQVYNRALSANEVLHNYNALKGRFS